MQKNETKYFDVTLGKVVHRDLSPNQTTQTKGKRKMADEVENGEVETAAEKRTDKKVRIDFIGPDGASHKHPVAGCRKIKANFIEAGGDDELDLSALDEDMIYRLAAFGASTLGRNEVNTTKTEEGPDVAADACRARWQGFRENSYRSVSSGTATPLILIALERAFLSMGKSEEEVAAKVAKYRAQYDAGDDEKTQAKSRRDVSKLLRGVPEIRQMEKTIREEREAARLERAPQVDLASL